METYFLPEKLNFRNSPKIYDVLIKLFRKKHLTKITIDFDKLIHIDSAGATILFLLKKYADENEIIMHFTNISEDIQCTLDLFEFDDKVDDVNVESLPFFESIGDNVYAVYEHVINFLRLFYEVFSFSLYASFTRKKIRRHGEVFQQALEIGVSALPIVALISFLVGFILALQSAAQLRQLGADIYVVDLVVISMVSEMGPLMTAILVAGRSGSAIAAEISSMVISEETDALKVMDVNPIPYLIVPKVYAIAFVMPMLTIFSIFLGVSGGLTITFLYLGISPVQFLGEAIQVVFFKDIMVALIKSVVFAMLIVITGSYFGFNAKGGSVGIGKAATTSVVASIFLVIVADSILGLIFYFPS
jgi:phospholipid/cholesterol/gamma-HCH transport system permease protein